MAELLDYLKRAVTDQASDLFLVAGGAVSEKVEGNLYPISEDKLLPPDTEALIAGIDTTKPPEMTTFPLPSPAWPGSG